MAANRRQQAAVNVNLGGIANAYRQAGFNAQMGLQSVGAGLAQAGRFNGVASLVGSGIAAGGDLLGNISNGVFGLVAAREQMTMHKQMPSIHTEQYKQRVLFNESRALNAGIPLTMHYGIPHATAVQYAGPGVTYGRPYNNLNVTATGIAQGLNLGYV